MTENGNKPDLDLSDFAETRMSVKGADGTLYSIPLDFPTPTLVKMARCITVIGTSSESYADAASDEGMEAADREMWEVMTAVMARAEPPVADPRAAFTSMAAMKFLGFLAGRLQTLATTSTPSLPSPPSTEEASASETSSETAFSTRAPGE